MKNKILVLVLFITLALAAIIGNEALNSNTKELAIKINPFRPKLLAGYEVEKVWDLKVNNQYTRAFAIDSQNNMYVSEAYEGPGSTSKILKYDKQGNFLGWFGKGSKTTGWHSATSSEQSLGGTGEGEFHYIFKVAFDKDDNMYVIDKNYYDKNMMLRPGNERIQKFDKNGKFLAWLGQGDKTVGWHFAGSQEKNISGSTQEGAVREPTCIYLSNNDLLVTSSELNKLDQFDLTDGKLVRWLGKAQDGSYGWHNPGTAKPVSAPHYGREEGAFNLPFDCKIDSRERLYVLSYNSDPVIAIFDYKAGKFLDGLYHSEGYKPANIILDKYDNLIMSDNYFGGIRFVNYNKKQVATLLLGPGGDYFAVGDFAFDSQGYLYFLEKVKNKVYKLKLKYE